MTGFRLGWAVGPRDLIAAMSNIQSHQSGGPCSVSQVAAAAAVAGPQDSVDTLRETLQRGRDEMVALLAEVPGVKVARPEGTFYCFCDFSAVDPDSARLAALFLEKLQVVTVPGVEFGLDGFLRLSFCGPLTDVREGVRRIKWLLDARGPATLSAGGRLFSR
jgi:aspartate aminotransferase